MTSTPPDRDALIDAIFDDIIQNGHFVKDANGDLIRKETISAAMLGKIMEWNERKKLQNQSSSNPTGALLDVLRREGTQIKGDMPAVSDGDDATTR